MFTKKSLPITVAFILVIALASLGVAYGAWTDTLHINGNVSTGTFDVSMDYMYYDWDATPGCTASISADGKTLTVVVAGAYPGFHCGGGASIRNLGTIPAKVWGLTQVSNNVPTDFWGPVGLAVVTYNSSVVPAGSSFILTPGAGLAGVMWDFTIPATETGHEGESYTFAYTFLAEQSAP